MYMKNIRIEEIGDIHSEFPYLEVFFKNCITPFLEIGISEEKEVSFKFYPSKTDFHLTIEEWESILSIAKAFLPKALKNEDDFLSFLDTSN